MLLAISKSSRNIESLLDFHKISFESTSKQTKMRVTLFLKHDNYVSETAVVSCSALNFPEERVAELVPVLM